MRLPHSPVHGGHMLPHSCLRLLGGTLRVNPSIHQKMRTMFSRWTRTILPLARWEQQSLEGVNLSHSQRNLRTSINFWTQWCLRGLLAEVGRMLSRILKVQLVARHHEMTHGITTSLWEVVTSPIGQCRGRPPGSNTGSNRGSNGQATSSAGPHFRPFPPLLRLLCP